MKVPHEFHLFAKHSGQSTEGIDDPHVLVNNMYQLMISEEITRETDIKGEAIRRGDVLVEFLDQALSGPHSDDDLAIMWARDAQSGSTVLTRSIRSFLTYVRDEVDLMNKQMKNGSFVALDEVGNPELRG